MEVGHSARTALTAHAMWVALSTAVPDVVVLDLELPDSNGLDLTPPIREKFPGIVIIALTMQTCMDLQAQVLHLDADAYLTKPVKFVTLTLHLGREVANTPAAVA